MPTISAPLPESRDIKDKMFIAFAATSSLALGFLGFLYGNAVGRNLSHWMGYEEKEDELASVILGSLSGAGKAVIFMMQWYSILKDIKEWLIEKKRLPVFKTAMVLFFMVSTVLGAYVLARLQLGHTKNNYESLEEIIAAAAALLEGVEIALSLSLFATIKETLDYIRYNATIAEQSPISVNSDVPLRTTRRSRADTVVTVDTMLLEPADELFKYYFSSKATAALLIIPVVLLSALSASYLDEYIRSLPAIMDPALAYTLSAISVPGICLMTSLGLGSFCLLLNNAGSIKDLNILYVALTLILGISGAAVEFTLGIETGRGNLALGIALGSVNVLAQLLITQNYIYEGVALAGEAVKEVAHTLSNATRKVLMGCPAPSARAGYEPIT